MLSLALAVAMTTSSGALLSEPTLRSARLLDAPSTAFGLVLGQGGERQKNLEAMTRGELEMERLGLLDSRPTVVPGIIIGSAGAVLAIVGFIITRVAPATRGDVVGLVLLVSGLAGLVTGAVLAIIAFIRAGEVDARLRRVEQRINTVIRDEGLAPPQLGPPPPPPPPGAWRDLPQPPLVHVAAF